MDQVDVFFVKVTWKIFIIFFFCCPFTARVYSHFEVKFNCSFPISSSVHSFLGQWFSRTASSAPYRYLPLFIFWGIWLLRNLCIFENKKPAFSSLIARIDGLINSYPVPMKIHKTRNIGPEPSKYFPCGFFDGAVAENIGGSGYVIFINDSHYFSFSMGCGSSSNTRAELLACWGILRVSLLMGIPLQLIYGDSMVITFGLTEILHLMFHL